MVRTGVDIRAGLGLSLALISGCTQDTLPLPAGRPTGAGDALPKNADADADADARASDSDVAEDAGQREDAGTPPVYGDYYVLEPKDGWLSSTGATFFTPGVAFVRVGVSLMHGCELAGPVWAERNDRGQVVIRAHVWIHRLSEPGTNECGFVADFYERTVPLPDLGEGAHEVIEPRSGSTTTVEIVRPADCQPRAADRCTSDCECPDSRSCLACSGPDCEPFEGRCRQPCNPVGSGCCGWPQPDPNLECPPEAACALPQDGTVSPYCVGHRTDPCLDDRQCPPGMFCPVTGVPRGCMWAVELNGQTRKPCTQSSECEPGLVCVAFQDSRRCQIPCFSARSRCPEAHRCVEPAWVCEWIGE